MIKEWLNVIDGWKQSALVWDIETTPIKDDTVPKFRIFGAYSYKHKQYYLTTNIDLMIRLLKEHDIFITYNGKDFDIPILYDNFPFLEEFLKYKYHIDLLEVLKPRALPGETRKGGKGRAAIIGECRLNGIDDNRFPNLKLSSVISHIHKLFDIKGIGIQKEGGWIHDAKMEDFDYNIFETEESIKKNWELCKKYLKKDIVITKELFEFLDSYFSSFKDNLSIQQINKLQHINSSTGAFAYKAMCNDLGFDEEYGSGEKEGTFEGAFVEMPYKEYWSVLKDGYGFCIDFASQHPHHQWSANLFTPVSECLHKVNGKCPNPYNGDGVIFKLQGTYCGCEMGRKEKWLRHMYFLRLFYKHKYISKTGQEIKYKDCKVGDVVLISVKYGKGINSKYELETKTLTQEDVNKAHTLAVRGVDPREYSIKIIINSSYGISSSPSFIHIFTPFTGADTTAMSRQSTAYMKQWMIDGGYNIAYGDTDSLYIFDPFRDKEKMKNHMAKGVSNIKKALPFVDETYNMDIDAEFTHMFFFPDLPKSIRDMKKIINKEIPIRYRKKNYVYITNENKVKLMGLPIIKGDASLLGKKIFKKYLYAQILEEKQIKFEKEYLQQLIDIELKENPLIAAVVKNCNTYESYVRKHKITIKKAYNKKIKILVKNGNSEKEAIKLADEWIKERPSKPTSLQSRLAELYGEGKHLIIKNSKYGLESVGGFYAKIYDKEGNLTNDGKMILENTDVIDISKTWKELNPFIETEDLLEQFKESEKNKKLKKKQEKIDKLLNNNKNTTQKTLI